ncbi:hypothetical protein KBD08_04635 [Candidatus Babeliales bacterium]|nr:hypothetical protein [Candidatus Babeliales bacterium]
MFFYLLFGLFIGLSVQGSQGQLNSRDISPIETTDEVKEITIPLTEQALQQHQINLSSFYVYPGIKIADWIESTESYRDAKKELKSAQKKALRSERMRNWVDQEEQQFLTRAQSKGYLLTQQDINNVVNIYVRGHQSPSILPSVSSANASQHSTSQNSFCIDHDESQDHDDSNDELKQVFGGYVQ